MFKKYILKVIRESNEKELLKKSLKEFEDKMALREDGYVFDYKTYDRLKVLLDICEERRIPNSIKFIMDDMFLREDYLEKFYYMDFKRSVENYLSLIVSDYLLGFNKITALTDIRLCDIVSIGSKSRNSERFQKYILSEDFVNFNKYLSKKYKRDISIKFNHDSFGWGIKVYIKDEF